MKPVDLLTEGVTAVVETGRPVVVVGDVAMWSGELEPHSGGQLQVPRARP